ncbi:MAG: hypothetical protein KY468_19100 [Armatimonadetes bacterium]|nr:hypothetical protein [Armatimonadota bacterium]
MPEDHDLTPEQQERFLSDGYILLHDCFSREAAEGLIADAYSQLGYDPNDPGTWEKPLAFLYPSSHVPLRKFAPRAWAAVCRLVGGEERLGSRDPGVGQWVINFRRGADEPWQPPSPAVPGWHKDGNFFRHFLDSPEQGLLVIPIFSDIEHRGGGTFLAVDSVPVVARFLRDRPEGVRPDEFRFMDLVTQCSDFREVTGRVGDVALIHPFMLHNFSQNHSGRPRFITNLCISLNAPMEFNRPRPEEFSPVEQAVLRGLGEARIEFTPTAPRERIDPKTLKR